MRNLTDLEKNAFRRLVRSDDGQVLYEYLEEALQDQDKSNRLLETDRIGRGQGKSILLDEMLQKLSV